MDGKSDANPASPLHTAPDGFECWQLAISAGSVRPTSAAEWAGAIVHVAYGVIDVHCLAGGHRRFVAGDLLALDWLPVVTIRNPGPEAAALVAVRRRVPRSADADVTVERPRAIGSTGD